MSINDLLGLDKTGDLEWFQMVLRAVIIFILALIIIRITGMRAFGTKSAFDVVLSITIGAILSRCITGHYPFFSCLAAAFALAVLHRLTAIVVYFSPTIRKLAEGEAIVLFRDNKEEKENKLKNFINETDIEKSLREENLDGLKNVKSIWYETDGKISVVKKDE